MTTQTQILDRLHAINEANLTTVTPFRYFVPELWANTGQQPWIVPYVQRRTVNNTSSGAGVLFATYTIEQLCVVGQLTKGLPGQSMSELAESIMDEVETVYAGRLRLELDYDPLVNGANFNGATVPRPDPQRGLMTILFSHTITTSKRRITGA